METDSNVHLRKKNVWPKYNEALCLSEALKISMADNI